MKQAVLDIQQVYTFIPTLAPLNKNSLEEFCNSAFIAYGDNLDSSDKNSVIMAMNEIEVFLDGLAEEKDLNEIIKNYKNGDAEYLELLLNGIYFSKFSKISFDELLEEVKKKKGWKNKCNFKFEQLYMIPQIASVEYEYNKKKKRCEQVRVVFTPAVEFVFEKVE